MQCYTVYFIWKLLYMFPGDSTTHHQERKQLYLQHLVYHTVIAFYSYRGRAGTGLSVLWMAYAPRLLKILHSRLMARQCTRIASKK
jgi:hypothetical protein